MLLPAALLLATGLFARALSRGGAPTPQAIMSEEIDIDQPHVGGIRNAYNMEERCKVIEQLGGTFYAEPRECPDLDLA
ncbi:hypothetical protein QBC33DRAFT_536455 [Phialemonium atrogriseum]|uniref:Uncharacterized protein n=1 Tax=Phialemonium atrogriseum TaxID=1093897 RepID=A0AAJ0C1F6_9PEZI|nr:uncharacterized protein QBC33DRAFT_536455 [Phialemonium atrogriseum]KAK1768175.1 hypothetical protein QBC33DRAFT_536455 [Phialemonium atrogriseum]